MLDVINKHKPVPWSGRGNPDAMELFSFIDSSPFPARQACVTKPSYTLAPQITAGSYSVDEKLIRTSHTVGTTRSSVLSGTTMTLTIQLYNNNALTCCSNPAHNVQVEIWHCDANGLYADVAPTDTCAKLFLREYQVTNNEGRVTFTTIYPGWHSGRAPHIHLRARVYDSVANATFNFVSQLFFADGFTDEIYAMTPYNFRGGRDTQLQCVGHVVFRFAHVAACFPGQPRKSSKTVHI